MQYKVVVCDDQPLLVEAFAALVNAQADMQVVATATDGATCLAKIRQLAQQQCQVDVVLMDIRMPGMDGITATAQICQDPQLHNIKVLMLTTFDEEELVIGALAAGASGFLLKDAEPTTLLAAVRALAAGKAWLDPSVTKIVLARLEQEKSDPAAILNPPLLPGFGSLTEREAEILELVCQGWSNAQIATKLYVAETTVKTHMKALLGKTGCKNRIELIVATLGQK